MSAQAGIVLCLTVSSLRSGFSASLCLNEDAAATARRAARTAQPPRPHAGALLPEVRRWPRDKVARIAQRWKRQPPSNSHR